MATLQKESKIKVLENFYALDYVFFGKPVKEIQACCPALAEDYISVKGAMMSIMVELFKLVDHSPKPVTEKVNTATLLSGARCRAKIAREMAQKLVASDKGKLEIKTELKEALNKDNTINISDAVEEKIILKAFGLACDNLLIASTISESLSYEQMNEWSGRIIEDSYKILRDSLVESASLILLAKLDV
jgi:hypothetical protein